MPDDALAKAAYEACMERVMPHGAALWLCSYDPAKGTVPLRYWDGLPQYIQDHWHAIARAVLEAARYYDICEKAAAVCASKHHVSTSVDGYGHSEVDWQLLGELKATLSRAERGASGGH